METGDAQCPFGNGQFHGNGCSDCLWIRIFEFAISAMLAIIVMHDAMGVRMETGKQGKVLNEMIDFLRTEGFVEAFKKKMTKCMNSGRQA